MTAKMGDEAATVENLTDFVLSLKAGDEVRDLGGYLHKLEPGDALWVPQGWFVAEKYAKGVLVYGVRKSFVMKEKPDVENYGVCIKVMKNSKRSPAKMESVLGLLSS